jgi:hypothetical protein
MGTNVRPNIVTNGLIFCLDAGNRVSYVSGSTTWNDISGTGAAGTLINAVTFNPSNLGSLGFGGTDQYVTIPSNAALKPNFPFTVCMTALPTSTADTTTFQNDSGTVYSGIWILLRGASSYAQVGTNVGTTAANRRSFFFDVPLSQWVHVAVSWTAITTLTVYLNGAATPLSTTNGGTATTLVYGSNPTNIARRPQNSTYWTGQVGNIQMYNRALSAQEIVQNYNAVKNRFGLI